MSPTFLFFIEKYHFPAMYWTESPKEKRFPPSFNHKRRIFLDVCLTQYRLLSFSPYPLIFMTEESSRPDAAPIRGVTKCLSR